MVDDLAGSNRMLFNSQKEFREKATSSLDDLRSKLNVSPAKTPNWSKTTPRSPSAYSASVDRLKEMLRKYETLKSSEKQSFEKDRFNQTIVPQPDELAPLFNDQHTLMQHLESQVSYYKDALKILKQKAEIVIEENTRLHEQLRSQVEDQIDEITNHGNESNYSHNTAREDVSVREIGIQAKIDLSSIATSTDSEDVETERQNHGNMENNNFENRNEQVNEGEDVTRRNINLGALDDELVKMRGIYSSRTKNMEGLLKSARDELDEKQKEINSLQSKLWEKNITGASEAGSNDATLCIKCAHNQAVLGHIQSDANGRVLQRIQRENVELSETIAKQRQMLENMRKKELEAYVQVKKSCEMAEQIQLEKHEVTVNLHQLKQELGRLKEQNRNQLSKANDQLKQEKLKLQFDHEENINNINKKLDETAEALSRTELHLERANREKLDLRHSLEQIKEENASHDTEMEKRLTEVRGALAEANHEKTLLEQECQRLVKENKTLESLKEQKLGWSNSELIQLKKRLVQTERNLECCKEECIRLTECLQNAEKQVQIEKLAKSHQEKIYQDQLKQIKVNKKQNEEHLELLLKETEGKYEATRQELGGLLESQMQIANGFKAECKKLTERLEETEKIRREQLSKLTDDNNHLKKNLEELSKQNKDLKTTEHESRQRLQNIEKAMIATEQQLKSHTEKAISLMNKYNAVLRERQLLCDEIEFLRAQLPGFRHSDRISISDLDSTEKAV